MGAQSVPKTLYVVKISSGQSVFCPMKDKPIQASKCIKCKWNSDGKIYPLPPDELRGVGYVTCGYLGE